MHKNQDLEVMEIRRKTPEVGRAEERTTKEIIETIIEYVMADS